MDKTESILRSKITKLSGHLTDANKRDLRKAKRELKQELARHTRRRDNRELTKAINGNVDE